MRGTVIGIAIMGALLASGAQARPTTPEVDALYRELMALASSCDDPTLDLPNPHVIVPDTRSRTLIRVMLAIPPERCPGVAATAREKLTAWVGEPERPDLDLELARLLYSAASRGLGGPPDPVLAEKVGRMLWLLERNSPAMQDWSEAEREAWLIQPATIALLEAHVASPLRTAKAMERLADLRLRRDVPGYDPERAIGWLERGDVSVSLAQQVRLARLLTDGGHITPDFARAARPLIRGIRYGERSAGAREEMLRIGRLALNAAENPTDRAEALRIFWAASLDDAAAPERDALIARLDPIPSVELAPEDAEAIAATVAKEIPIFGIAPPEDGKPEFSPILVRALIGPDGRVAMAQITQSSGSAINDRAVLAVWVEMGHLADLSATARGRFVWTDLPPVVARYAITPLPPTG